MFYIVDTKSKSAQECSIGTAGDPPTDPRYRVVGARDVAEALLLAYPEWTQKRSNEDFDRAQGLAQALTDYDREHDLHNGQGPYGYSAARFKQASKIVSDANAYSDISCARRERANAQRCTTRQNCTCH